jgi:hypothetical protein
MRGKQSKTLLLGCLIGVAVGVAVVPWIGIYVALTDTDITEVARGISAVANTFVLAAPFATESVGLGIAIYMPAAIGCLYCDSAVADTRAQCGCMSSQRK